MVTTPTRRFSVTDRGSSQSESRWARTPNPVSYESHAARGASLTVAAVNEGMGSAGEDNTGNERSISLGVYFGESAGRKLARKTPLMTRKKYRVTRARL